jgi:hypothetical protein
MKTKLLSLAIICIASFSVNSQNLLNTNSWTTGSGSVAGFSQNGSTSENSRTYISDPFGSGSMTWVASPDANSNADGGWNTSYHTIDNTKTYRFVVWLKKTNSNSGASYFGCQSWQSSTNRSSYTISNLNNSVNRNPYFWAGDLPQLNKWYMLVGYVHSNNYSSTVNYGGIYDGATGQKIINITDFKFFNTTTILRHRAYLYFDTNTSDRQYFYAPRMEMVDGNEPPVEDLLGLNNSSSTNLLEPYMPNSSWAVGSGNTFGFGQNGVTSENSRELGRNHIGEEVVLWKAAPDASSNADGGWNSGYRTVLHTNTHRFSVWIKKTNSNYGLTYFGFNANRQGSLRLNGTFNGNPYFWLGDLPKLNRWYLLVGYVHKSSHTGTTNTGGIYDGTTGEKVRTITDYKLKNNVTLIRHRSYLYYDTNILDRQYFYEPRIDPITGNEPTIHELLKINDNSKIILSYDTAGNQTQNFYCGDPSYCSPPAARKQQENKEYADENIVYEDPKGELFEEEILIEEISIKDIQLYPNPTEGLVTLKLKKSILNNIHSIKLYNTNASLLQSFKVQENLQLDLTNKPSGVYLLHIHLNEGKSITKKIIKK